MLHGGYQQQVVSLDELLAQRPAKRRATGVRPDDYWVAHREAARETRKTLSATKAGLVRALQLPCRTGDLRVMQVLEQALRAEAELAERLRRQLEQPLLRSLGDGLGPVERELLGSDSADGALARMFWNSVEVCVSLMDVPHVLLAANAGFVSAFHLPESARQQQQRGELAMDMNWLHVDGRCNGASKDHQMLERMASGVLPPVIQISNDCINSSPDRSTPPYRLEAEMRVLRLMGRIMFLFVSPRPRFAAPEELERAARLPKCSVHADEP